MQLILDFSNRYCFSAKNLSSVLGNLFIFPSNCMIIKELFDYFLGKHNKPRTRLRTKKNVDALVQGVFGDDPIHNEIISNI